MIQYQIPKKKNQKLKIKNQKLIHDTITLTTITFKIRVQVFEAEPTP